MGNRRRLTFTPFWRLTNRGWLPEYFGRVMRWGDGTYLNHTVIIPLVGEVNIWDRKPDNPPVRPPGPVSRSPRSDIFLNLGSELL